MLSHFSGKKGDIILSVLNNSSVALIILKRRFNVHLMQYFAELVEVVLKKSLLGANKHSRGGGSEVSAISAERLDAQRGGGPILYL